MVKIQMTSMRNVANSAFCLCFRIAGSQIIISCTLLIDYLGLFRKKSVNNFGLTTLWTTWLELHTQDLAGHNKLCALLLLNWIIRVQSWMQHKITRNCKEYSMFITIYSCGNFFNGGRQASEDLTKQNNDVIMLKTNAMLGRSKDNFQSQGGCFHPLLSKLTRGKWRGGTSYNWRTRRAIFHDVFRLIWMMIC